VKIKLDEVIKMEKIESWHYTEPKNTVLHAPVFRFESVEQSEWVCYLFGGSETSGVMWRPIKGKEPNWFWRKMQYLCFGNKWVKKS
jgi:hypothetical protein